MTTDSQLPLPIATHGRRGRVVTQDAIEELCTLLRGRRATASELVMERPGWNERFIRLLARAARPRVLSFPGSDGYRLSEDVSDAEIAVLDHAGNALIAQGRDNMRSGILYRRLAVLRRLAVESAQRQNPAA